MKILLVAINAKYIHSNLAVYCLKEYAKEYSDSIEIAEYTINNYEEQILEDIYRKKPDVVAFSCYIWNFSYVKNIISDLKKILPNVDIWAGGPEVSYDANRLLGELKDLKGIIQGEGEITFKELVRYYVTKFGQKVSKEDNKEIFLENIKGLIFKDEENRLVFNEPRELMDLDEVPFCYNDINRFENKIIYYETSRGCPFSCSYCLSSIDKKVRLRSLDLVFSELQYFIDNKIPQVKFVDRTFNCSKTHARKIWEYILEHDNGITNFHFEVGADLIEEADLEIMSKMRPGLIQLEIGVQSTNTETIKEIDRTMDFEQLSKVVKKINSFKNIHQHLDLIAGLPYEDYNSFKKSFNDVYGLEPEQLQLGFLKVLKGSKMHLKAKEYGIVYKDNPVYEVLYTHWLSYDEVLELKKVEEMVEIYYNSSQFSNTIRHLQKEFENSFVMYKKIGDFYEIKGYDKLSHSRMARYDILLEFIKESVESEKVEIFKELMVYDLYLRENLKSRPQWAKSQEEEKNKIRDFYIEEEANRRFLKNYMNYNSKQMMKMTHIETFEYNVTLEDNPVKEKISILFDYQTRNPLNYEARTCLVDL